ncbi:hypothetical protein DASB73_024150 [Starmerella bacillaris]|uniref:Uncharacterized protein n=1 Tax=Starmerella bacillaris TaxID=1247836 RepID=A0AAV5RKC7_STABA|nr:hypothetical protein DASB73_024150 [Starmerella bacillaris]
MEIPSSSPIYTPLTTKSRKFSNENLPNEELFVKTEHFNKKEPKITLKQTSMAHIPPTRETQSVHSIHSTQSTYNDEPNEIVIDEYDSDSQILLQDAIIESSDRTPSTPDLKSDLYGAGTSDTPESSYYTPKSPLEPFKKLQNTEDENLMSVPLLVEGDVTVDSSSDCGTIIDSDEDNAALESQNFLRNLLTESVLEQLPLPPSKMENFRNLRMSLDYDGTHKRKHSETEILNTHSTQKIPRRSSTPVVSAHI